MSNEFTMARARSITTGSSEALVEALCLSGWRIDIELGPLDGGVLGEVHVKPEYQTARIQIDALAIGCEAKFRRVLRHEFLHIVIADLEILGDHIRNVIGDGHLLESLNEARRQACERIVRSMERMIDALPHALQLPREEVEVSG